MRVVYFGRAAPIAERRRCVPDLSGPRQQARGQRRLRGRRAGLVNFLHTAGQLPSGGSLDYGETGSGLMTN